VIKKSRLARALLLTFLLSICGCWGRRIPQFVTVTVYQRSFDEGKPQYRLYLQGATPDEVRFDQPSLVYRHKASPDQYEVYGTGSIMWRSNTVHINDGVVALNGRELPIPEFKGFVIRSDGSFSNGYISSAE
jgi:hypothetical protein